MPVAAPAVVAIEVGTAGHTAEAKAEPPRLSIVVLPFANLSGDPEQEYFVDGVTESLTTDLSRISGCFVIARNTAFTYKGKPVDARMIGRELNVRYVMEGSVQRSGGRMRVNVQLIDAESGAHLWSDRFDKPLADLFDMQDEIVARLARQLDAALIAAEARRAARSPNPDAMDLYFQGLAPAPPPQAAPSASERRHITALAAELAPAPGGQLPADPEDLGAIVGAFRRYASSILTHHGGVIGQSRGREILAYFGYPTAQENDAERAVRAALAIQRRCPSIRTRT